LLTSRLQLFTDTPRQKNGGLVSEVTLIRWLLKTPNGAN
jgi:hypothetical protein